MTAISSRFASLMIVDFEKRSASAPVVVQSSTNGSANRNATMPWRWSPLASSANPLSATQGIAPVDAAETVRSSTSCLNALSLNAPRNWVVSRALNERSFRRCSMGGTTG
jgi:hypothetical protein